MQCDLSLSTCLKMVVFSAVSFPDLLFVRLLPLFLTGFVVYFGRNWLLFPVAFGKAFLYSFLGVGFGMAFGGAGWLLRWLFLFSELLLLPVLWLLWSRLPEGDGKQSFFWLGLTALITAVATIFDYYVVLPFGRGLLS